ncbi:FolB domain-containing protein [Escherichia coli]
MAQPAAIIRIKNLRLRTFIGIKEEEINNRQDIVINVTIHYPADKARTSEDINDALNYRTVTKNIIQHVENNRFSLLGDIDPAIIFHLHDTLGMSVDAINKLLTKESGLLGLTEVTSDCRYVEDNYATKEDAKRAMDVYCHRLAKYIGAYTALMDGRLDAVVFTGGIGENAAMVRELSLGKLGVLGFEVDHERNLAARFGKSGFINKEGTRPAVVIPTNEELVIAQDASRLTA